MGSLPAEVERSVRLVSVAPHVQRMFSLLPQTLRLDALVSAELPDSARQLLKLALLGCSVRLGEARLASAPGEARAAPALDLTVGERRIHLGPEDLRVDLRELLPRILSALFEGSDVAHLLESLAFQSSSLATLRKLTAHMLAAADVGRALSLMLAGITSGHGLGFNRAAVFLRDEARETFTGAYAVGPADEAHAHRIWEEIELEDLTIETVVDDVERGEVDTTFQDRVRAMTLAETGEEGDEIAAVLGGADAMLFEGPSVKSPGLRLLGAGDSFVLAALRAHERVLGLLFADNLYTGDPIRRDRLEHVGLFVAQTALVCENLSLLLRVGELARVDGLTGLLVRRELDERFAHEVSRAARTGAPLSLLVIDVDHFKDVNDARGHEAGDAVLRTLGGILRGATRGHDVVARYGGDELVALLPGADPDQAAGAAARIGRLAAEAGISVSIGAASWPVHCTDAASLFTTADEHLYRAKREGRRRAFVGALLVEY